MPAKAIGLIVVGVALTLAFRFLNRFDPWGTAQAAFDRREIGTALSLADTYLRTHPADPRASLLAARCETRLGRLDVAEAHYQNAKMSDAADVHARALGLIKLNRPNEAAKVYQDHLAKTSDDTLALQRLASIRIGQKRWREVLDLAAALINIPDAEVAGQTLRAVALHESRQYKTAISAFERVVALDPRLETMPLPRNLFWRNYATDLLAEGRTLEARKVLEKGLDERTDAPLLELLGQSHLLENEPEKAEACWKKAIEADETFVDTWLDLGQLANRRKQWDEAVRCLKRATLLDPHQIESHYALSLALRNQGRRDEADRENAIAARLRAEREKSRMIDRINNR